MTLEIKPYCYVNLIQRAFHRPYSLLPQDMGIDHGGGYILVTEQFLHGANIGPVHEKMGGK